MALQKLASPSAEQSEGTSDTPLAKSIDLADIQGDVLIGLQKDAQSFVFFSIVDAPGFQSRLSQLVDHITSSEKVAFREKAIQLLKASQSKLRLELLGWNIAFTKDGLDTLLGSESIESAEGIDPSYLQGARPSATSLGDNLELWEEPFVEGKRLDGVLLFTGPKRKSARKHASRIVNAFGKTILCEEAIEGWLRPERGHEHFGFLDGVSQPGIRGLTEPANPADKQQGLPGQDLIQPGEFVFGYPTQVDRTQYPDPTITKDTVGPPATPPLAWMENGSYMVFRRLEQKVLAFREFVEQEATKHDMDHRLLAARMVGRWPSGAPLVTAPLQDDPALGADETNNNNFEYQEDDPHQRRCPYAAHIRKTYPRDDLNGPPTDLLLGNGGGEATVQRRRLRRAGIPFGEEVDEGREKVGDEDKRGLLFVSYQTSIREQFEFVQASWANNPAFVSDKRRPQQPPTTKMLDPGHDPIIGQSTGERWMDEPVPNYPTGQHRATLKLPEPFVIATGGAYLFMPAISTMRPGGALV